MLFLLFCFSVLDYNGLMDNNTDLFVIECEVMYPILCGRFKICNDRFISVVYRTIYSGPPELSYSISFTIGLTLDVQLIFISINETIVTAPTNTTTNGVYLPFAHTRKRSCFIEQNILYYHR